MQKSLSRKPFVHLACMCITYRQDDEIIQRYDNLLFFTEKLAVTGQHLNKAQLSMIQKMHAELGLQKDDILSMVFMTINTLGQMTPEEFNAEALASKSSSSPTPLPN